MKTIKKILITLGTAIVMVFFISMAMIIAIVLEAKELYRYGRQR